MFLLLLLVGMMAFVLWYVIDRRAKNRLPAAMPPTPTQSVTPAKP